MMIKVKVWNGKITDWYSERVVSIDFEKVRKYIKAMVLVKRVVIDRWGLDEGRELIKAIMRKLFEYVVEEVFVADNCLRGKKSIVVRGEEWSLSARDIFVMESMFDVEDLCVEINICGRYCSSGAIGSIEVRIWSRCYDESLDTVEKMYILQEFVEVDYCKVW